MFPSKFSLAIGLSTFLVGYFVGNEVEKIHTQDKLDSITEHLNTFDNKLVNISTGIELKQNDLLLSIAQLNKQLQAINLQQVSGAKNEQPKINTTVQNNKIELTDLTYNELIDKLKASDLLERQKIIQDLMKKGTPEIKQQIIELALDENTDKELRYSVIEAVNWQEKGKELADMVNSTTDINAIGSALEAAKQSTFKPGEALQFKESLINLFQQNRDDVPQAAIIDYFKNEGTTDFNHFLNQIQTNALPIELQQQIKMLQMQQIPSENQL